MIYKTLTAVETNQWLRLLRDTIEKGEVVENYWNGIMKTIRSIYKEKYTSKWYWRLWHEGADPNDIFVSWGGNISRFGSIFTYNKLHEITYHDMKARDFVDEWSGRGSRSKMGMFSGLTHTANLQDMYQALYHAWQDYADKPFQIDERDVGYFLELQSTNERLTKLLKCIGEQK